MRKLILTLLIIILSGIGYSYSQLAPSKYLVRFTDKDNSPYSVNKPGEFLSQRAIDRRIREGIDITEQDLPVNPAYIDSVSGVGVKILNTSKWFNAVTIKTTDTSKLEKIFSLSFVKDIQNVGKESKGGTDNKMETVTNDDYIQDASDLAGLTSQSWNYSSQSITALNYGYSCLQIDMLGGTMLHDQGYLGDGLIIAVLDAGFYKADQVDIFDSLWINGRILGTKDFVNPGGNVFTEHHHGMNVLSVLAANKPGFLIGTAPHAKYWLLRSEDTGSEYLIEEYNWVSAAEFADSAGVDIINSSLGYSQFWDSSQDYTYKDMDGKTAPSTIGADIAVSKGILVVNSAGNQGSSQWKYITAPSDGFNVLCVGAVNSEREYALFSSKGPSYDGRIKPNVSAMGQGTAISTSDGNIVNGNGTSFSSPLITGMAACLWQTGPDFSVYKVIDAIEKSCNRYSNPDTLLGYGIPDFTLAKTILSNPNINDFDDYNVIDVFPNPFYDYLNVYYLSSKDDDNATIEIFDITGKRVFLDKNIGKKTGYNMYKIYGINYLSQGLYIIRLQSNGKIADHKIIKLKNE